MFETRSITHLRRRAAGAVDELVDEMQNVATTKQWVAGAVGVALALGLGAFAISSYRRRQQQALPPRNPDGTFRPREPSE